MPPSLVERILAGDERAAARVMRFVDDRAPGHLELLKELYPHTGKATVVGVTGAPGSGKSTLVDRLVEVYRKQGIKVGVVAVDPTSPFSGGAILGDRIRMQRHFLDSGVFIRSLATRGHLGGLSRSASDVVHVLDAFGCGTIVIETVGVGQDELEVARLAHTTCVVLAPGLGDDIQAIKAGILEIADVLVVNKADRDGADATVRDLEQMIALSADLRSAGAHSRGHAGAHLDVAPAEVEPRSDVWEPPVIRTVATKAQGIDELVAACARHRDYLFGTDAGAERRSERTRAELERIVRDTLLDRALASLGPRLDEAARNVEEGREDPYSAADRLARDVVLQEAS